MMTATRPRGTRFRPSLATLLILATTTSRAGAQLPIASGRVASGTLSFDGRATVGNFTGTTTIVTGEMTGGPDLASVTGWVEAPVGTLKTGKDKRDEDLRKSMEADKYPSIRYELTGVTPKALNGDSAEVTLHGRFLIHGVTREVEFPATVLLAQDQIRIRATTPLDLGDYRIGGLSKALGILKMHEDIVVHVDVTFGPDRSSPEEKPLTGSAESGY